MPSITRKQIITANDKMGNGFSIDVERYVVWGEKQCTKRINLDENHVLLVEITYVTRYARLESGNSVPYYIPSVWLQYFTKGSGAFMTSCGMGYNEPLGEKKEKRLFSVLQKLTHEMTDEKIMEVYARWKNPFDPKVSA